MLRAAVLRGVRVEIARVHAGFVRVEGRARRAPLCARGLFWNSAFFCFPQSPFLIPQPFQG